MNSKHYSLILILILGLSLSGIGQTNLLEGWNGRGDTNQSTSFPDRYGWAVTVGTFSYANSTGGIRWFDVKNSSSPVHYLDGSAYEGRLLMVRWDGAGSTSLNSVYSFPVTLEANKKYKFSWIYEWWNNTSVPVMTVGISSDKAGTTSIVSKEFNCSATKNLLQKGEMEFYNSIAGASFLTIKANNLAVLCGIGELMLIEVPLALESSVASVSLNYYETEKKVNISPNGTDQPITISAPQGIHLSATVLPSTGGELIVSTLDSTNVSANLVISQGSDQLLIPVQAVFPGGFFNLISIDTLNADGAWCWFNDPRAIYYKGIHEQTYISWVNRSGDIMIGAYDHTTGQYHEKMLFPKLEADDHDNPALFIRNDGRLIVFFSKHTTAPGHRLISTNPEDISSWGEDYQYGENVTYPYPFQADNQIFVFYRGLNWHPTLMVSNDNGQSFDPPAQIIAGGGARPYIRYCQDKTGAIHMAFTTGHPRDVSTNKIYYACFKNGQFFKADGTLIKAFTGTASALNIDNNEAETVYDASQGKGWIWDIAVDQNNRPVMVYAAFPSDTDHRYRYARWTGTQWEQHQITTAGKWFPQTLPGSTESEPNYSGGITFDSNDPSVLYLSKQVKSSFEIFRFVTPDQGITWDSTALTWNTPPSLVNIRPFVPRNHKKGFFDLVWLRGSYVHYTNYSTSLVFHADSATTQIDSIAFDFDQITLKKGVSQTLKVSFFPFLTVDKQLTWTSSDETIVSVSNGTITARATGMATITARTANGQKAVCRITVLDPDYLTNAFFDFGTSTSPVATQAIGITESSLFSGSYGWSSQVSSRDRGTSANDELRDFNMSSQQAIFKVLVNPGFYSITVRQGDLQYAHDNMNLYVNDSLKLSSVTTAVGSFSEQTFTTFTSNNFLEFRFEDGGGTDLNWVVNSISLSCLIVDTSEKISIPESFGRSSKLTIYEPSGRRIFSGDLDTKQFPTFIQNLQLPRGLYLVQIKSGKNVKIIKHLIK